MNFSIFGETTVEDGGRTIDLGGPRQRLLLALLLTGPNQVVATSSIIDALWDGEDQPERPERTVHTYVSRLRKAIGADRVISAGHGYRLETADDEFDATRFTTWIEQARTHRSLGDPARACQAYETAQQQWSGRPWAEFADRYWATPEVDRLERLRADAVEEHAGCLLELGEPARALELVEALLAEHPMRDGLRRVQMLALHRLGRTVEATRVFRTHREQVVAHTGLEPSAELAELEARIVRQDPELDQAGPTVRGYELLERVRDDESGVVWRARHRGLDRELLLEIVDPAVSDDPEFIRYFETRMRLLSRLDGGVVPVVDAWRDHRGAFVVVRALPSLAESRPERGWSSAAVRRVVIDLGRALAVIHDSGITLGPVDPDTVGFTDDGTVAVLGVRALPPASSPDADIRSLGALGLHLLQDSGDVDTPLLDVLTTAATGMEPAGSQTDPGGSEEGGPGRDGGGATNRGGTSIEQPGDVARRLVATVEALGHREPGDETSRSIGGDESRGRWSWTADDRPAPDPGTRNPYKGLRPFDIGDADDFYGRKEITGELVQRVLRDRFVVVVGPSGSGKSSLIRAGVLPALIRHAELGGHPWFGVTMVPGHDPYEALETALLRIAVNPPATLLEQLTGDSRGIIRTVERCLPDDRSDLLLLIDQFEELWTTTPGEIRERFVAALVAALSEPGVRLRVVATLRADHYDRPLAHPELGEVLADASVPLPALSVAQMEEVVMGPAAAVGLQFQPSVVAEFVRAGTSSTASLPLVQFALTELVEKRSSDLIGLDDLERLGGVAGSVGRRAEATYQSLDPEAQAAARGLFGRLVNLSSGEPTRRRAARSELAGEAAELAADAFVSARLLMTDRDQETREPTVEVAHEALLSSWPRLQDWINDDAEELRVVGRLVGAAARWQESGQDDGELLRGAPLAAAATLAHDHPDRLSEIERRYVEAGERHLEAEQHRERRRSRRLRNALAVAAVLLAISIITSGVAVSQRDAAQASAFEAESTRLASTAASLAGTDPSLALLVAAEAYRRSPNPETLGGLQRVMIATDSFLGHRVSGESVLKVFWVDDDRLAVVTADAVKLIAADTGETLDEVAHALSINNYSVGSSPFASAVRRQDGAFALSTEGGSVTVFTPTDFRLGVSVLTDVVPEVRSLAFAPDSDTLYAGGGDGSIHELSLDDDQGRTDWEAHSVGDQYKPPDGTELGAQDLSIMTSLASRGTVALAVSESHVVSSGAGELAVWGRATKELIHRLPVVADNPATQDYDPRETVLPVLWFDSSNTSTTATFFTSVPEYVGTISPETGQVTVTLAEGLNRTAVSEIATDVTFVNDHAYVVAVDGGVRVVDVNTGALVGTVAAGNTGFASSIDVRGDTGAVAIGSKAGVSIMALDGSGLLFEGLPLGSDVELLTAAPGGNTVAATTFTPGGTDVFDRRNIGFRRRDIGSERDLGYIELLDARVPDPDVILEWKRSADGVLVRSLDRTTLEPLSKWSLDFWFPLVSATRQESYGTKLTELFGQPAGFHRIWIRSWPEGEILGDPVEFTSDGGIIAVNELLDDGRLLVGTRSTVQAELWAMDTERREMVDPPFRVDGGAFNVRQPRHARNLFVVRSDGAVEERDPETYEILRTAAGPEPPTRGDDPGVFVDDSRDLWLTINNKNPRLIDAETGRQIGDKFPHHNRDILLLPADGADGAPIQLVTSLGDGAAVWNLATETWYDIACQSAGRNLTVQEWELVGPRDREATATCPQWPAPSDLPPHPPEL